MSTPKQFGRLEIGEYFSIPGQPGILCEKVKYQRWGEGAVSGGYNYLVLKHPRKDSVNCGGYAMPDMDVAPEPREKHLKRFVDLDVGKRGAFRGEPSTIIKRIRTKKLRSGKTVNAALVSAGTVKSRLAEHSQRCPAGYLFIRPDEQLLVA
ncbi:MAG: hypothetical protein WC767_03700 [Candidatus Paceibacterota bacterium]|jgi:hypothetical protein